MHSLLFAAVKDIAEEEEKVVAEPLEQLSQSPLGEGIREIIKIFPFFGKRNAHLTRKISMRNCQKRLY